MFDRNNFAKILSAYMQNSEYIKKYWIDEKTVPESFPRNLLKAFHACDNREYKKIEPDILFKVLCDVVTITDSAKNTYEKYIYSMYEFGDAANISAYYQIDLKWQILRKLNDMGYNISYYCNDDVDPVISEEAANHFEKDTPNEILKHFENHFDTIRAETRFISTGQLKPYNPLDLPNANDNSDCIIEGMMLDNTLNNIIGQSKAGKSFFSYQMAYCVQNGIDFLERKTSKRDVLVIDFELREKSIKDRFERVQEFFDLENPEPYKVISLAKDWGEKVTALSEIVDTVKAIKEENPKLGLVIFDCYYRFADGDENSAGDTMKTLSKLKTLTKNMSVVYVHHSNKTGVRGKESINSGSGSGVHGRIVDQSYTLDRKDDGTVMVINSGRDWYGDEIPCYRNEYGFFEVDDAELQAIKEKKEKAEKKRGKISLRDEVMKNYPELCELIGEDGIDLRNSVFEELGEDRESLKEKGFVIPRGSRKVTLPPA